MDRKDGKDLHALPKGFKSVKDVKDVDNGTDQSSSDLDGVLSVDSGMSNGIIFEEPGFKRNANW
jgi:hypothetical protein